jgi:hypothetical protein
MSLNEAVSIFKATTQVLMIDHGYFLKKIGNSICISKNLVYFRISIE